MTRAPRRAITWQIAAPIPPEAPVTRTVTRVASPPPVIATSLPPRLDLRDFCRRELQGTTHESIELRIVRHAAHHARHARGLHRARRHAGRTEVAGTDRWPPLRALQGRVGHDEWQRHHRGARH